uniref:organelle RRM domain-containing protein 6, chloroplastic-like n=1 Tax=Erigeron canadensis TaxID=72917 RepID=UPI001CB94538|nr:organelle RRM domain-containing protein 6, chloroplastic-like [Erigeron canadensis]
MAGAAITTTTGIRLCSSSSSLLPPLNCTSIPLIHYNNRLFLSSSPLLLLSTTLSKHQNYHRILTTAACHSSSSSSSSSQLSSSNNSSFFTKLYVSGLSFRTSEESLRNAFQSFGQLIEVNLVMDKIANRSRGFAFLRYATKEESDKAIEGMHGKFLDGRVIFVEFAKPRSQLNQGIKQDSKPYR